MRIGISGAQSVGKTTILNALRSEDIFKEYSICNEVTRKVRDYGLPINEEGTDVTQKLIMQEHIVNVFMHDRMLTDRTVLDGIVYTTWLHENGKVTDATLEHSLSIFEKLIGKYDLLFYIKPEFDMEDDGVRSVDIKYRNRIVELFINMIDFYKVDVIQLTGSVRERVQQVLNVVESYNE